MPDLISIANDLKTAPDQWLVQQSQNPSGTTPPYLVLAELQRRQMLRGGGSKPPSTSVAQDTLAATMKQLEPPAPQGPPPPPGMAPPSKDVAPTGEPTPGAKPPQNMARGGQFSDDDEDYLQGLVRRKSLQYGLDPNLMFSLVKQESQFKPGARSPKGAIGPMQLMPGTAKMLGVNPHNVEQNVDGGMRYFRQQLDDHGGNLPLALAAYNAGPGAVKKWGGVPPFKETRNYIKRITSRLGKPDALNNFSPRQRTEPDKDQILELPDRRPGSLPQGSAVELDPDSMMPPAGPMAMAPPGMPENLPASPAPGAGPIAAPGGLGAAAAMWKPPETEELTGAKRRKREAEATLQARQEALAASRFDPDAALQEDNVLRVRNAARTLMGKEVDYSKLEAAIGELQSQAERSLQPDIGLTLRTMGFALLASHAPNFGAALGEAGLHTQGVIEKQRREARADYIAALKAGVDLQTKKGEREEKVTEIAAAQIKMQQATGLQAQKDAQQRVEDARKDLVKTDAEKDKAQTAYDKLTRPSQDEDMRATTVLAKHPEIVRDPNLSPAQQVQRDLPQLAGQLTSAAQTKNVEPAPEKTVDYYVRQVQKDGANWTLVPTEWKQQVGNALAEKGVDVARLDATGRQLAAPQDPEKVKYWAAQVRNDAKNWSMVNADKGLAAAVRQELAGQGVNVNQLDATMRQTAQFAHTVLPHITDTTKLIDEIDKKGKLGPVFGRWNEFRLGKWGAGDPDYIKLRTNINLIDTAIARIHGGARGGSSPPMIAYMHEMLSAGPKDAASMRAAIGVFNDWVKGYENMAPGVVTEGGEGAEKASPSKGRTAVLNGREIYAKGGAWYYKDTNEKVQ